MPAEKVPGKGEDNGSTTYLTVVPGSLHHSLPARRSRLCRNLFDSVLLYLPTGADDGFVEALLQQLAGWELGQVLGDVDAAGLQLEHLHSFTLLARAEDQADRLLFALLPLVAVEPAQVELHLSHVRGLEVADLQLDDY